MGAVDGSFMEDEVSGVCHYRKCKLLNLVIRWLGAGHSLVEPAMVMST